MGIFVQVDPYNPIDDTPPTKENTMGMIMDLVHSLTDMKKLAKLQDTIEEELNKLDAEGKLPADLKAAFEKLKNQKSEGGSTEDAVEPLKEFVTELEKHEDIFPDNIKAVVSKFESVTEDLEGIAERVDSLNKK